MWVQGSIMNAITRTSNHYLTGENGEQNYGNVSLSQPNSMDNFQQYQPSYSPWEQQQQQYQHQQKQQQQMTSESTNFEPTPPTQMSAEEEAYIAEMSNKKVSRNIMLRGV